MYHLSTELIEKLSDLLQVSGGAPAHRVTVYRKNNDETYDVFPFDLPDVTSILLERRWNMAADELSVALANINGQYSPDYRVDKRYHGVDGLPLSAYANVISAFNQVTCDLGYGDELRRVFTGQLQGVSITENPPLIKFDALNAYRKLLKPVDPISQRELVYENKTAFFIIQDLCRRAGLTALVYDNDTVQGNDFTINLVTVPLGTNYADALKPILESMNHRLTGGRHGEIRVVKQEMYSQQDFHNWEFDDYENLTEGSYTVDPSVLRNRVIIKSNNDWQAFEDPFLLDYCNGERISAMAEIAWADTPEQKWAAADYYFLSMRRRMRRLTVAVPGNPSMDIGDLVKVNMLVSAVDSKFMITALQSQYSEQGYFDIVDLEYVDPVTGHLCEPAEGGYAEAAEADDGPKASASAPVRVSLRGQIVDEAKKYLGVYYEFGGNYPESGYGLDSAHFVYQVFKKFGLMSEFMPLEAQKQWVIPITQAELQLGDLIFYVYGTETPVVKQVVIYIGNLQMISAHGGGVNTTTQGIARSQNAKVKIQRLMVNAQAFYGRVPGLS